MFQSGQQYEIQTVRCPFDPAHFMPKSTFRRHIQRCKSVNKYLFKQCPFDVYHIVKKSQFNAHIEMCKSRKKLNKLNDDTKWEQIEEESEQQEQQRPFNQNILSESIVRKVNPSNHQSHTPLITSNQQSLIKALNSLNLNKKKYPNTQEEEQYWIYDDQIKEKQAKIKTNQSNIANNKQVKHMPNNKQVKVNNSLNLTKDLHKLHQSYVQNKINHNLNSNLHKQSSNNPSQNITKPNMINNNNIPLYKSSAYPTSLSNLNSISYLKSLQSLSNMSVNDVNKIKQSKLINGVPINRNIQTIPRNNINVKQQVNINVIHSHFYYPAPPSQTNLTHSLITSPSQLSKSYLHSQHSNHYNGQMRNPNINNKYNIHPNDIYRRMNLNNSFNHPKSVHNYPQFNHPYNPYLSQYHHNQSFKSEFNYYNEDQQHQYQRQIQNEKSKRQQRKKKDKKDKKDKKQSSKKQKSDDKQRDNIQRDSKKEKNEKQKQKKMKDNDKHKHESKNN